MTDRVNILLVLRSGGDFSIRDVQLIARHINGRWRSHIRPRIICLWDKASSHYNLRDFEVMPLKNNQPGTWARIALYAPEMEEYRPCLYIDLDTAVTGSLEKLIDIIPDKNKFITLEDFWQKKHLATGLMWMPKNCEKIKMIYQSFKGAEGSRMDRYIRRITKADLYWQDFTNTIHDFKPGKRRYLEKLPENANLVCFHGKPRIWDSNLDWVNKYRSQLQFFHRLVTLIIPYKEDRGWLQEAIDSVPSYVQLLLGQGNGNWPENFNKVFPQAEGDYVRWLHEDDMLSANCIEDSVDTILSKNVDFIHGQAMEFYSYKDGMIHWRPKKEIPSLRDMLERNYIHSATLMYKKEVFEKIGLIDETLNTAEEYEYNLRCLKAGMRLGYCPKVLAYYRRHPMQKVRTVIKMEKDKEREMVRKRYRA